MMKQTDCLLLLIVPIAIGSVFTACGTANTSERKTGTANAVPIRDFDGLEHLLHKETDSIYVINFWATWCKPCVAELPHFEQLGKAYEKEKLKVILISLDFPNQIESRLIPFIEERQLRSEVWVLDDPDANTWIDRVSPQWSGAIPATLVYNRFKREFREQSFETYEELNEIVKPLVPAL